MACSKNILLCQTRLSVHVKSALNRKSLVLTSPIKKQPLATLRKQTFESTYSLSNIKREKSSNYYNENACLVKNSDSSENYDKVDRHVSLGQESNKHEDPEEIDDFRSNDTGSDPKTFQPKNVLILTKLSRYQYERQQHAKDMSEDEFRHILENRGSDYTLIKYYHNVHRSVEEKIVHAIEKRGLQVKTCQRTNYCDNLVEWADLIVSAGGDGTFLLGASKIRNKDKPIIGINTDPTRSEGHLCLPKHWSLNVDDAVQALLDGKVCLHLKTS